MGFFNHYVFLSMFIVKHKRKDTVTTTSVHTGSSMAKCHKIKQYLKKFFMNFRIGYGFS